MARLGTYADRRKVIIDKDQFDAALTHFPAPIPLGASVGQSDQDNTDIFDALVYPYQPTSVNDDFTGTDSDAPKPYLWDRVGTQRAPYIKTNACRSWIDVTTTDVQRIVSKYKISGDFDIQCDFDLISQPTAGVRQTGFYCHNEDETDALILTRRYETSEKYFYNQSVGGSWGSATTVATSATSGKLRLVRTGTTLVSYYWNGSSWTQIASRTFVSDALYITITTQTNVAQSYTADIDNFTINSGTIVWPELADSFSGTDGDAPNEDLWDVEAGSADIQSNKLRVNIGSSNTQERIGSIFKLSGDFDIQMDYDLDSAPSTTSWAWTLRVHYNDGTNNNRFTVQRRYAGSHLYQSYETDGGVDSGWTTSATSDTSGKLRIVRSGDSFTGYYWNGSSWTTLGTDTVSGLSGQAVQVVAFGISWGSTPTVDGNFDNFTVNSGTIVWPENTNPNRKKIAITKSDGTTQIYGEIEHWDDANEKALLWVSKHDLEIDDTVDTELYIYFDPAQDDNDNYIGHTAEENTVTHITGDDFTGTSGDDPDPDLWEKNTDTSAAGTVEISANALRLNLPFATADEKIVERSVFRLSGDFEAQVDYTEQVALPPASGQTYPSYLGVQTVNGTYIRVGTSLGTSNNFDMFRNSSATTQTSATNHYSSGKFKIKRVGSTFTIWYWTGTQWEWDGSTSGYSFSDSDSSDVYLEVYIQAGPSSGAVTDYDNFTINSGTVKYTPAHRVWDDFFKGVWHLAQDPTGGTDCILDSTVNINHGTPAGTMVAADLVSGLIGKALDFDGSDDYIDIGDITDMDGALDVTLEFAGKFHTLTIDASMIRKWASGQQAFLLSLDEVNNDELRIMLNDSTQAQALQVESTAANLAVDTDYVIAAVWEGAKVCRIHKNGSAVTSTITGDFLPTSVANVTERLSLMARYNAGSPDSFVDGLAYEIRISDVDRSAAWLKATSAGLSDDLVTFGDSEPLNAVEPVGFTMGPHVLGTPTIVQAGVETPVILPASGQLRPGTAITMTCPTSGASIYYTTDGSTPDDTDILYTGAILFSVTVTIKAIGVKTGFSNSAVATSIFTEATSLGRGTVSGRINEPPTSEPVTGVKALVTRIWRDFFVEMRNAVSSIIDAQIEKSFTSSGSGGAGSNADGTKGGATIPMVMERGAFIPEERPVQMDLGQGGRPERELVEMLFSDKTSPVASVIQVLDAEGYFTGKDIETILSELGETRRENGWDLLDTDSMGDIAFTTSTRTFTVSVKSGQTSYHFWVHSKKITKTGDETVVIPDVTGTYYIIFDDDGVLTAVEKDSLVADDFYEHAITGLVYWNATAGEALVGDERHGKLMDSRTHHYNHVTYGARYQGPGMAITGLVVGNTTYTNTTSGQFWDEDIQHLVALQTTHKFLYREGANGAWRASAADNEIAYLEGTDTYYSWNEWTGATWQLTEGGPTTDFWNIFLVAVPSIDGYTIMKIIGQTAHANRAAAQAAMEAALSTLATDGMPNEEFVFLAALITNRDGELQELGDGSTHLDLRTVKGGSTSISGAASHAADVATDTSNFAGILSTADTDAQKALETLDDYVPTGFTDQSATGDGTTTVDWTSGHLCKFTFGAANEVFTFTAPSDPCNLTLMMVQDSVGGRTATWPSSVKWVGGTAPTLSTAADAVDMISMYYDGTNYYASADLNFS